jgi:hypothetical protein
MLFIKNFHRNENEHRLFNLIYHKCSKDLYWLWKTPSRYLKPLIISMENPAYMLP